MILLFGKLLEMANGILAHFVTIVGNFTQQPDYEWTGWISSNLTQKGEETVGALSTVIHMLTMFLAQLSLVSMDDFYNIAVPVS